MVVPLPPLTAATNHHKNYLSSFLCLQYNFISSWLYNEPLCKTWWNDPINTSHYQTLLLSLNLLQCVIILQKLILITFKILKKKKPSVVNFLTAFVKFPDLSLIFLFFSNSLIFPHREFFFHHFPYFPCFPESVATLLKLQGKAKMKIWLELCNWSGLFNLYYWFIIYLAMRQ